MHSLYSPSIHIAPIIAFPVRSVSYTHLDVYKRQENDRQYNIYFTLNDSVKVSMNNIEPVIKQIAAACGIEEKNVIVNDLYLQGVLQPSYETIARIKTPHTAIVS